MFLIKNDVTKFIFFFALIDLLFLPKISYPFLLPISLFVCLPVLFMYKWRIKYIVLSFILIFLIIISVINGFGVEKLNNLNDDDIKRFFQFMSFFLYFFVAYKIQLNVKDIDRISRVIKFLLLLCFMLNLCFFISPSTVTTIISIFYPESTFLQQFNTITLRFSYIFTDPNSAGYLYVMCLSVLLLIERKNKVKMFFVILVGFMVLFTQSRGALLAYTIVLLWCFIYYRQLLPRGIIYFFVLFLPILIIFLLQSDYFLNFISMFSNRFNEESSLGGGRIDKYIYFINNFNFLPYGVGYNLQLNNGEIFRPHSDLIRLNFSYGIIVMIVFFYLIKPKIKEQIILLIPFVSGFLINSMIDEYRSFGVFLLFYGMIFSSIKLIRRKNETNSC